MRLSQPERTRFGRGLRREQTDAERRLWHHLRDRRLSGFKFVRQEPIGRYFADFLCREAKLIVEADGGQHATNTHDEVRDRWLVSQGYSVLRFWNVEIMKNTSGVLDTILAALPPSPRGRGEGRDDLVVVAASPEGDGEGVSPDEAVPAAPPHPRLPPRSGDNEVAGALSPPAGRGERAATTSLVDDIRAAAPGLRGRLLPDQPLADLTWFRVGGPAEVLFTPADEEDLAALLAALDPAVPVTVIGLGSNLIVRDGGVPGVVIRLGGRAFGSVEIDGEHVRAGTAVPDMRLAKAAAEASLDGLAFYRGIPGSVGGALRMNAGAHGGETTDVLVEARGIDRGGRPRVFTHAEMGFRYRHSSAPDDVIFTSALFRGRPGERAAIEAEMERVTAAREAAQPIRERTGGSTFKNPDGGKAWQLIDAAGCRGLTRGGAQVSPMHCNFLINRGGATAADIEGLGEEVRRRVRENSGYELHWEIKRIGVDRSRTGQ